MKKGEKLYEELATEDELKNLIESEKLFTIRSDLGSENKSNLASLISSDQKYLLSEEDIQKYIRLMLNESPL